MPKGSFCKININYPVTGASKSLMIDDFRKMQSLHGLRMASEFDGELLGEEYAGCTFKITGGNDGQGFPMMQGILKSQRVRLLMKEGQKCYRARREGQRRRKSIRGCIVGADLHAISVVLVKKGGKEIAGLTDTIVPKRLIPKRASKLRRLLGLPHLKLRKEDHKLVCPFVRELGRTVTSKSGKSCLRCPKIQRLVTDKSFERKAASYKHRKELYERSQLQLAEYRKLREEYAKRNAARKN